MASRKKVILLIVLLIGSTASIAFFTYRARNYTQLLDVKIDSSSTSYPYMEHLQGLLVDIWNEANSSIQLPIDAVNCIANLSVTITGAKYNIAADPRLKSGLCLDPSLYSEPLQPGLFVKNVTQMHIVLDWDVFNGNYSKNMGDGRFRIEISVNPLVQQYFGSSYNLTLQTYSNNDTIRIIHDPVPTNYGNITAKSERSLHLRLRTSPNQGFTFSHPYYYVKLSISATVQEQNDGLARKKTVFCSPRLRWNYDGPHTPLAIEESLPDAESCPGPKQELHYPQGLKQTTTTTNVYLWFNEPLTLLNFTGTITLTYDNMLVRENHAFAAYLHYDRGNLISISYQHNNISWE